MGKEDAVEIMLAERMLEDDNNDPLDNEGNDKN